MSLVEILGARKLRFLSHSLRENHALFEEKNHQFLTLADDCIGAITRAIGTDQRTMKQQFTLCRNLTLKKKTISLEDCFKRA